MIAILRRSSLATAVLLVTVLASFPSAASALAAGLWTTSAQAASAAPGDLVADNYTYAAAVRVAAFDTAADLSVRNSDLALGSNARGRVYSYDHALRLLSENTGSMAGRAPPAPVGKSASGESSVPLSGLRVAADSGASAFVGRKGVTKFFDDGSSASYAGEIEIKIARGTNAPGMVNGSYSPRVEGYSRWPATTPEGRVTARIKTTASATPVW